MIITYLFAILPKLSIFIAMLHVFRFALSPVFSSIQYSVIFSFSFFLCAVLSLSLGSIGALYQVKIKRLLAYSAIANMGYILLGISTVSIYGFYGSAHYFITHLLGLIQIFSIVLTFRHFTSYSKIRNIVELLSISTVNIYLALLLALGLLSLAGIPPLAGFFGKIFIYSALIYNGHI
jgi:NADH-quinone oxidoreductase subunit N